MTTFKMAFLHIDGKISAIATVELLKLGFCAMLNVCVCVLGYLASHLFHII